MDYLDLATDADFIQLKQIAQWSDQDIEKFHRLAKAPSQCLKEIQSVSNTDTGYIRLDFWQQVRDTTQETLLNTDVGYLPLSSWRKARDLAQETLNRIDREPAMHYLDLSTEANFIQLGQIAQWSDQDIEKFHQLITTVSQCLEEIQSILNADAGYLHLDSWQQVRDTAQETLDRIDQEPMGNYQDRITDANFNRLKEIAQWSDQDIKKFHQLATVVTQCFEEIKTIQNAGYLRTSHWKRIKYQTKKTLIQSNPLENFLKHIHHTDFVLLKQIAELRRIAQWSKRDVEEFRQQYVTRCEKKFSIYFDRVESKSLTERQREACIIDEDNNLVLAGAGTGKTSTMVGRAGFLIHSGQAKPDQILMLAFANKAAREMQERLDERVNEKGIVACTFHKLGMDIIVSVEKARPSISPLAEDDALLKNQVGKWLEEKMRDNSSYKEDVLNYFSDYLYPVINPFDFKTKSEYFEYIHANEIRSLKGESVKSLGECLIANHLFALGIKYQYEAYYKHKTSRLNFRQYKPDFYLPDYGIYIEHFGVDCDDNTAPFVDREKYLQGREWKRNLHKKYKTRLIETYHYELTEGSLQQNLEQKLKNLRVKFHPLSPEEMLEELRKFGAVSALAELLAKLLKACKRDGICPAELQPEKWPSVVPDQLQQTRTILSPIYKLYQNHLKEKQEIDFDDMIHKAIGYVESGRFISHWRYILVDEFQDISEPRARLVKALQESANECSLFCVGDDWQSIYRFTGSDIRFTTEFKKKFGSTKITKLDKTFRFNNSICDIASRFILKNPAQIKKSLTTKVTVERPAVSLLRQESPDKTDFDKRIDRVLKKINQLAKNDSQFQADGKKEKKVFLLGRFHRNLPNKGLVKTWNKQFSTLEIQSFTIHKSKGMEADYVVVLGLEGGKHGFPSKKTFHCLLEALLPKLDDFMYAEERRLFYVALTRAKQRVYLIVDMANASEFVVELLDNKYPLELDEFEIDLAQKYYNQIRCSECETGILVARERKDGNGKFYGCSYYPLCDYTENGCQKCGNQMGRIRSDDHLYKVCLHPACDSWIPLCPECGTDMVDREGSNGSFWGCKNYRVNDEDSCRHIEDDISPPLQT